MGTLVYHIFLFSNVIFSKKFFLDYKDFNEDNN